MEEGISCMSANIEAKLMLISSETVLLVRESSKIEFK
jgi:hypothetical protein